MIVESVQNNQHLQVLISDADNTRRLLADFLKNRKAEAIELLNLNGIAISRDASMKSVRIAYLKALKESDNFRTQISQALTTYVTKKAESTPSDLNFWGAEVFGAGDSGTTTTTTSTTPSSDSTKSSFWGSLGKVFTPTVIQDGIKTGLTAISTSIQSKANESSEQNALALEQLKLQQIMAQSEANKSAQSTGLSTGWKIAIGVIGAVVVIGVIIMVARKN